MSYTTWTTRLDKITYAVSTEFGKLDSQELNWKPNPDTWSIAQNLDHIIRVLLSHDGSGSEGIL